MEKEFHLPQRFEKFNIENYVFDMSKEQDRQIIEDLKYCYESSMFFADHYKEAGNYQEAQYFYELCLQYYPNDETAKFKLFWLNKLIDSEPKEKKDVIFKFNEN